MESVILAAHVLVALAVIGLVLLQQGKGADAGASFGGGASQTVFGSSGSANFLSRSTKWLSIIFFSTSFALAYIAKDRANEVANAGIPQLTDSITKKSDKEVASDLPSVEEYAPDEVELPDLGSEQ
jgi:preprotein translocase subunit SecG